MQVFLVDFGESDKLSINKLWHKLGYLTVFCSISTTMERFIAYFDYLGFKEFIERNDLALGLGKYKEVPHGIIADISDSSINCINFSDTVIFFTNDTSDAALKEILTVAHKFNWVAIDFCFPVRGAIVLGEMIYVDHKKKNHAGGIYNINSVFGKGLVNAHLKAESQDWAGTVLDESFIKEVERRGHNVEEFLFPYAKKYTVPYKDRIAKEQEYVLNIIKGDLNEEALKNYSNGIRDNFSAHNKSVNDDRVQQKIENTLLFLKSYYKKQE
jgi:hypothetical protein